MKGFEVISVLKYLIGENDIIVSSNGNISREAYHLLERPQFYLRGSMGLPVSVGFGLALSNPNKRVIVITGDGNFLMGLGSITTTAFYRPKNLKILILDNSMYFTTGGQETVSSVIDYAKFLESLKIDYACSKKTTLDQTKEDLTTFLTSETFSVLHLQIEEGKMDLENIPWHPEEITEKFKERIQN